MTELMRILAVLNSSAAFVLGESLLYIFGYDVKDSFNQLVIATLELWKLGIIFLRRPKDLLEHSSSSPFGEYAICSQLRLGIGTHGASNVAQRFSNALVHRFQDIMDEAEEASPHTSRHEARLRVSPTMEESGSLVTRRRPRHASGGLCVCPQERLYGSLMYTDDPTIMGWVFKGPRELSAHGARSPLKFASSWSYQKKGLQDHGFSCWAFSCSHRWGLWSSPDRS